MSSITQVVSVRDNTTNPPGTRKNGLTLSWVQFTSLVGVAITPRPTFTEIGNGQYSFSYDAEALGEAAGQIDCSSALSSPGDRYIDVMITIDSSRIHNALSASGFVRLDMTQSVPLVNSVQTLGEALNGARVQALGAWSITGNNLILYNSDGSICKSFTLDSTISPTVRS